MATHLIGILMMNPALLYAKREPLTQENIAAIRATIRNYYVALPIMVICTVCCGIFSAMAADGGVSLLFWVFLLATVAGAGESVKMWLYASALRIVIINGVKIAHADKLERAHYSIRSPTNATLYFAKLGMLSYRPIRGLPLDLRQILKEGQEVQLELVGDVPLFVLGLTPVPSQINGEEAMSRYL